MSSQNYEESGYSLDLDLLTSSCYMHVSYLRRSCLVRKVIIEDPSTFYIGIPIILSTIFLDFFVPLWKRTSHFLFGVSDASTGGALKHGDTDSYETEK